MAGHAGGAFDMGSPGTKNDQGAFYSRSCNGIACCRIRRGCRSSQSGRTGRKHFDARDVARGCRQSIQRWRKSIPILEIRRSMQAPSPGGPAGGNAIWNSVNESQSKMLIEMDMDFHSAIWCHISEIQISGHRITSSSSLLDTPAGPASFYLSPSSFPSLGCYGGSTGRPVNLSPSRLCGLIDWRVLR